MFGRKFVTEYETYIKTETKTMQPLWLLSDKEYRFC